MMFGSLELIVELIAIYLFLGFFSRPLKLLINYHFRNMQIFANAPKLKSKKKSLGLARWTNDLNNFNAAQKSLRRRGISIFNSY